MINRNAILCLSGAVALFLASCSNKSAKPGALDSSILTEAAVPENQLVPDVHPGKKVYEKYCQACHQPNGRGVSSAFPPLTPNPYVADKKQIIHIVLNGMKGEIEVNGESFNGLMTPHDNLTNQELADVISYVRSSFGNKLEAVTAEEVEAGR